MSQPELITMLSQIFGLHIEPQFMPHRPYHPIVMLETFHAFRYSSLSCNVTEFFKDLMHKVQRVTAEQPV